MKKLDETSKASRDFGTDLLRIILMAMIVLHHMIVHGFGLSGLQNGQMMGGEKKDYFLLIHLLSLL